MLILIISVCSSIAIVITTLPAALQLGLLCALAVLMARQCKSVRQPHALQHHGGPEDSINCWTIASAHNTFTGQILQNEGYRSANLLVLVFRDEQGKQRIRIPIWRDAVSAPQFSYLSLQLLFNTH